MDAREQVREAIRAEVARQNPVEDARHSLELIAETAVRFEGEDSAHYRIIDENGEARTRLANGSAVDFTIRDLVADLRARHPTLFHPTPLDDAAPGHDVRDGAPTGDRPDAEDSADADPPSAEGAPATADAAPWEPAMPTAAPFGTPIMDRRFDDPEAGSRDVPREDSGPVAGSRQGPRDWLILEGGKRPADDDASQPAPTGSAPAAPGARPDSGAAPIASPPSRGPLVDAGPRRAPRPATVAYAVLGGLAVLSTGAYLALGSRGSAPDLLPKQADRTRARTTPTAQPPADPVATGSVPTSPASETSTARLSPAEPASITGVPEVIDTATLRVDGKVVRLVGVEWARGGRAENLTSYLAGREVTCQPAEASEHYRCKVEGRDLSQVVLYNGGGRASPNAPADLLAAENYARTERIGVWQK